MTIFIIAAAVACASWTVANEEVFREVREVCKTQANTHPKWYCRKFFYLFTCQYCFSHYVTAFMLFVTGYRFVGGFGGLVITFFATIALANVYMTLYGILRQAFRVLSQTKR
jgi:hypothetical protein